jgi:alkylation response protein AidB-like acyl-CoA dehydrogenase
VFQDRLGEAYLQVRAAHALLEEQAGLVWADARTARPLSMHARAVVRAMVSEVTAMATSAVDTAYNLAGGSAVYDGSPIQGRLRDMHTVTQHAVTARESRKVLGGTLVGEANQSLLW